MVYAIQSDQKFLNDVTEAVIEELNKLAAANDRLEMIEKYIDELKADGI